MQLFNLEQDPAEQTNLLDQEPRKVAALLRLLEREVRNGRCTAGEVVPNDREIVFLPEAVELPGSDD